MERYKKRIVVVSIVFIIGTMFYLRPYLGVFIWHTFRNEKIALTLNQNAELALGVGNYYFNMLGSDAYDLRKAQQSYEEALKRNPNILMGHYQLARIYFINGDFSRALEEVDKELAVYPQNIRSYYIRGLIYGYRDHPGDLDKAELDFIRFVKAFPKNWAGRNDLAWILIRQEKFKEARKVILSAFERIPGEEERNPWLWTALGVAHLNMKNYNKSRDAFLTAQRISENITPQYFWSAYPGNSQRNADNAFLQYQASLYFNLGVTYENLNEFEKAQEAYSTYVTIIPKGSFPSAYEVEQKINELSGFSQ